MESYAEPPVKSPRREPTKIFNDSVHGLMEFPPLCAAIIDTPQFQRLRYLKQLGAGYFVYPGASHNRFEHCLGVCHLAGQLVKELRERHSKGPEKLDIDDKDVLCVQIAGLCHDLGHGPFSHVFDNLFIPSVKKGSKWRHEQASLDMFDHMMKENDLEKEFKKDGLTKWDIIFIKEQIAGKSEGQDEWKGRPDKPFLYEIVANSRNGVDVDKWDYFRRDCLQLGMSSSFDHMRFLKCARVKDNQICVRDKVEFNMYEMFQNRYALHRKCYQHRVVKAVELMLVEAMKKANDTVLIPGREKSVKMSDCIDDMVAYTNLTDEVVHLILLAPRGDANLERAKEILQDIQKRQLWECVAETKPIAKDDTDDLIQQILKKEADDRNKMEPDDEKDLKSAQEILRDIHERRLWTFVAETTPIAKPDDTFKDEEVKEQIAKHFEEKRLQVENLKARLRLKFENSVVRVYFYRDPEQKEEQNTKVQKAVYEGFENWCKEKGYKLAGDPQEEIMGKIRKHLEENYPEEENLENLADIFFPTVVTMNFGKKDQDPVQHIRFYAKNESDKTRMVGPSDVSAMLPSKFEERIVRVYFCPTHKEDQDRKYRDAARKGFEKWCEEKGYRLAVQAQESSAPEQQP